MPPENEADNDGGQENGGGQENAGRQENGGQQNAGQQQAGGDWLGNLNPDIRAGLAPKNFGAVDDLAKAYLELEPKIAAKGVLLPGEKASDEEQAAFFNALGRPETPEDYDLGDDFKTPEDLPWNEEAQTAAMAKLHKEGLTNSQMRGVFDTYLDYVKEEFERQETEEVNEAATSEKELRKEWGGAYDAKLDLANRVVAWAGGKELADEIEALGIGRKTQTVRAFAKIGELIAEDGDLPDGEHTNFAKTPAEAKAEIAKLKADPEFRKVFLDKKHAEHEAAIKRMQALNQMAAGGEQP